MKRIARYISLTMSLLAYNHVNADVIADFNPYIGAEYQHVWMNAKNQWNQILPKSFPGATVFMGSRFLDNYAIELGYDHSSRQRKEWALPKNSRFYGATITSTPNLSATTKLRRTGGHVDLLGFLPVGNCFELLGSVGFGWVQPKIEITSLNEKPGTTLASSALATISGKGRGVVRFGGGVNYLLTDILGLRAKIGWESTSNLKTRGNVLFKTLGFDEKAFKQSTTISVGAFAKF